MAASPSENSPRGRGRCRRLYNNYLASPEIPYQLDGLGFRCVRIQSELTFQSLLGKEKKRKRKTTERKRKKGRSSLRSNDVDINVSFGYVVCKARSSIQSVAYLTNISRVDIRKARARAREPPPLDRRLAQQPCILTRSLVNV